MSNTMHAAALMALLALSLSCGREPAHDDHADEMAAAVTEAGHGPHDGHGHGSEIEGEEISDLDQGVEELFAASCEHDMKTFQCEECRYEVGVARVPEQLFKEGLLRLGKIERRVVDIPFALTGEVVFDEGRVTHLNPVVSGVIRKVHVTLGDRVKSGQLLIELESGEAGEAQERYLEAEAGLALAQSEFERVDEMRRQAIASEKEFLRARQELESARIRVNTAKSRLASMGLDAASTRALQPEEPLGRIPLRAPDNGTVLTLHAVPGENVHPEESLATVGDNSVLWVWCDLYERDIAALFQPTDGARRKALVAVKAWPGEEFAGTVDFISPSMDAATRTAKVRVAVQNPDRRLMAGMFAQVQILLPGSDAVAALPRAAVCVDEGRSFVFVPHHEDYFVRRPVVTGRSWGDWIELAHVPEDMTAVVTNGVFLLKSDVLRSKMGAGCAD